MHEDVWDAKHTRKELSKRLRSLHSYKGTDLVPEKDGYKIVLILSKKPTEETLKQVLEKLLFQQIEIKIEDTVNE